MFYKFKAQNNRYTPKIDNILKIYFDVSTKLQYSHHQEMNDDDIRYTYDYLLHEYRDLFIDKAVRNNRSKLAIANRHQER